MEGLQMTDRTKTSSWWPTMLCAAVTMPFVLIAVLGRHQVTVPDHTLHGWLPYVKIRNHSRVPKMASR